MILSTKSRAVDFKYLENDIMKIKTYSVFVLLFVMQLVLACSSCSKSDENDEAINKALLNELKINIPLNGNAWIANDLSLNERMITDQGLKNWSQESSLIRTFVRLNATGQLSLGIKAKSLRGVLSLELR